MDTMQLIKTRRSVRTFAENALQPAQAQAVFNYLQTVQNPYGLPVTWKLLSAKADGLSSPVIVGTDVWIAGKMRQIPHAEEAFGYSFEAGVLYAWSLGIGTTWIAGTMDRAAFEKAIDLQPGEVMPCVSPLGIPAKKMSLRESLMRKGIRADSRLAFSDLFFDGSFDRPLAPQKAGALARPLELVRLAPSAVNKQPWRAVVADGTVHFYEKHSKGYTDKTGWDLQKVDVGIALCHFAMGLAEQGRAMTLSFADPALTPPADTEYVASCEIR